jgi:hypothetical protein
MTTAHILDRPVWAALSSRQAHLALGDVRARRFDPDYGLFAATPDDSDESLAALAALVDAHGDAALLQAEPVGLQQGVTVASQAPGVQMIAHALTPAGPPAFTVTALTDDDGPQMLALATLTKPGPFFARTHQLGDFIGVKRDGQLIAMAGERMKLPGFTEVSGVCTHPDHRGHGYAGGLMRIVAGRILARGEIPFLHAYASNTGAISLYETLGFSLRSLVTMTLLARD